MNRPTAGQLLFILLFSTVVAAVEAESPFERLQKTEASLLDIGILRLEVALAQYARSHGFDDAPWVVYDDSRGILEVRFFKTLAYPTPDTWHEKCAIMLSDIILQVDIEVFSPILDPFSHRHAIRPHTSAEEDFTSGLRKSTEVHMRIRPEASASFSDGCKAVISEFSATGISAISFPSGKREAP